MSKSQKTKDTLLLAARRLFWSRGYSNVSLRQIAGAADVDVALISRYFGSKLGLFEATLDELPVLDPDDIDDVEGLIELVVSIFATTERGGSTPPATTFILMNAYDPEVGEIIREIYKARWQDPLKQIIGDEGQAAMFSAAMLGMSVAEKALHLDGINDHRSIEYSKQLRDFLRAAIGEPGRPIG